MRRKIEIDPGVWCACGEEVLPKRAAYLQANHLPMLCLKCGEQAARKISAKRAQSCVLQHKQGYMPIDFGSPEDAKRRLRGMNTGKVYQEK